MRKNSFLPAVSILFCCILFIAALFYQRYSGAERLAQMATAPLYTGSQSNQTPATTKPAATDPTFAEAPDISFLDAEGNPVKLSDFRGKPVVLNFWASWSNVCMSEFPILDSCYEEYKDDICFLMLNVTDGAKETKESAKNYWVKLETGLSLYYDVDSVAATELQVKTVPTTFFINAQGQTIDYATGKLTRARLDQGLQRCIASSEASSTQ